MGFAKTRLAAANPAVANRFLASSSMANGAYTLAQSTMPTVGARRLTVTHTTVTGADTLGTITFVGTDLRGETITEVLTPLAGAVATTVRAFVTVVSATQAGWVINGGNDTITIGCEAGAIVTDGPGELHAIAVNTTAAGTITLADAAGDFAVLAASIPAGLYVYDVDVAGWLRVLLGAASDVTVIHTPRKASSYS